MSEQSPKPLPFPPPVWRVVRCPNCAKVHCEATVGSTVRWRCRNSRCRRNVAREIGQEAA